MPPPVTSARWPLCVRRGQRGLRRLLVHARERDANRAAIKLASQRSSSCSLGWEASGSAGSSSWSGGCGASAGQVESIRRRRTDAVAQLGRRVEPRARPRSALRSRRRRSRERDGDVDHVIGAAVVGEVVTATSISPSASRSMSSKISISPRVFAVAVPFDDRAAAAPDCGRSVRSFHTPMSNPDALQQAVDGAHLTMAATPQAKASRPSAARKPSTHAVAQLMTQRAR